VRWLRETLGRRVDASALAFFRILWGALMAWEGFRKLAKVEGIYSPEYFHFHYSLFPFVEPLPEVWMMAVEAWVLIGAALCMGLGVGFRTAALVFTVLYAHFFLIDKVYYNNHFYLTILMNGLLAFTAADRMWSVRAWRERRRGAARDETVPLWNLALLRGQVIVLYFFGGIAKLNSDWIHGEPVRFWFRNIEPPVWPLSEWVLQGWFVNLVCYGGIALDLSAGFLLLHRVGFWLVVPALIGFHATNSQLFQIGIFPYLGVGMIALFFAPHWPRKVWNAVAERVGRETLPRPDAPRPGLASPGATAAVVGYLAFQALWPLRIVFYEGNPGWHEVGHSFSWRMMLRHKDGYLKFLFDPPEAERLLEQTEELPRTAPVHVRKMVTHPHLILQYVHALDATFEKLGRPDVDIRVIAVASLDGRPYQLLIDPTADLTEASWGWFEVPDWIVPLEPHKRPGLYPKSPEERRARIQAAVDEYARAHGLAPPSRIPLQPMPEPEPGGD